MLHVTIEKPFATQPGIKAFLSLGKGKSLSTRLFIRYHGLPVRNCAVSKSQLGPLCPHLMCTNSGILKCIPDYPNFCGHLSREALLIQCVVNLQLVALYVAGTRSSCWTQA